MTRPAYTALLLAVAVVAVAGCGGGDSTSETSAARGATGQQDTTRPQTGASGPTGTKRARPKRTAQSKQRSDKKTAAGESNTAPPAAPAAPTAGKQKPQPHALTPEELKEIGPGMRNYARELCKAAGLDGLAQQYNIKSGDPDDVAKAFAAGYAVALREDVAAGCKKGLLESR
jgi:hypothetical protein